MKFEWVYGFDYIDELVGLYYEGGDDLVGVAQDANYNVVSIFLPFLEQVTQYRYAPYGELTAAEDEWGASYDPDDWSAELFNRHQFQGLYYDRETGFYKAGVRYYMPEEGRFDAPDPNGQALILMSTLARNAQTMNAFASLNAQSQYNDGGSLYGFARNNPIRFRDPTGRTAGGNIYAESSEFDYFAAGDNVTIQNKVDAYLTAQRALAILEQTARAAGRFALQTAITATVPGAGLYFAARGLADSIEDIAENGLTWGNGLMAGVNLVGIGPSALATFQKASGRLSLTVARTRARFGKARGAGRKFNVPTGKRVNIDMDDVMSGHTSGGSRLINSDRVNPAFPKDRFPDTMSERQIEIAIRTAWGSGARVGTVGGGAWRFVGESNGNLIEMIYDPVSKVIKTAYPKTVGR